MHDLLSKLCLIFEILFKIKWFLSCSDQGSSCVYFFDFVSGARYSSNSTIYDAEDSSETGKKITHSQWAALNSSMRSLRFSARARTSGVEMKATENNFRLQLLKNSTRNGPLFGQIDLWTIVVEVDGVSNFLWRLFEIEWLWSFDLPFRQKYCPVVPYGTGSVHQDLQLSAQR